MQVGRAGRDGEAASCHLFLDDADFLRLRSLAHSDGVDAAAVASFLRAVFDDEAPEVPPSHCCDDTQFKSEILGPVHGMRTSSFDLSC